MAPVFFMEETIVIRWIFAILFYTCAFVLLAVAVFGDSATAALFAVFAGIGGVACEPDGRDRCRPW